MHLRLVKTIIVLPGTVLVFIPGAILLATQDTRFALELASPAKIWFWLALFAAIIGLALSGWAATLFVKLGQGTPAPWDPPKRLVIRGPYRHVRNPMIAGALLVLLAEAILFQSLPIATWMTVFFIGNAIYFPLIEEKGLEKRFGDEYRNYKANVPRWLPRIRPWKQVGSHES
ncbi:MAG: isoprenylcysteine carboxylmethyltransferase family protein [Deltaproteobacteria bacterium]|nr:isoprenylcysteine carboxylmethyltransferase family protein [Deltaproteobacteria bacterium]